VKKFEHAESAQVPQAKDLHFAAATTEQ